MAALFYGCALVGAALLLAPAVTHTHTYERAAVYIVQPGKGLSLP